MGKQRLKMLGVRAGKRRSKILWSGPKKDHDYVTLEQEYSRRKLPFWTKAGKVFVAHQSSTLEKKFKRRMRLWSRE